MQLPWYSRVFEIFGQVRVGDDYRIRTNREWDELFSDMDIAKRITTQQFHWLGHVVRMDEDSPPRRLFHAMVGGHRRKGQPRTRWKD